MNRNEFIKLLPTEEEINTKTEKIFIGKSIKTVLHERYYQKGFRDALDYITAKFPDFTEDEMKAIEMYKIDPSRAVNYLWQRTNLKPNEVKEFLKENQNKTSEYFKMAMAIYKESANGLLKTVCEHLYNSGRSQEYSNIELAEMVEQFLNQNQ